MGGCLVMSLTLHDMNRQVPDLPVKDDDEERRRRRSPRRRSNSDAAVVSAPAKGQSTSKQSGLTSDRRRTALSDPRNLPSETASPKVLGEPTAMYSAVVLLPCRIPTRRSAPPTRTHLAQTLACGTATASCWVIHLQRVRTIVSPDHSTATTRRIIVSEHQPDIIQIV